MLKLRLRNDILESLPDAELHPLRFGDGNLPPLEIIRHARTSGDDLELAKAGDSDSLSIDKVLVCQSTGEVLLDR